MNMASRIIIERGYIVIELAGSTRGADCSLIRVPWAPKPGKIKRMITLPHQDPSRDQRPIRAERRETLLRAIGKGRLWLKQIF